MKKTLTLVLALMLVFSMMVSAQAAVTPKGTFPVVDEPMTIKIAIPVSSKVEDIKTNKLTLWMQEQTGITFEIVELSGSDTATQINMMMNSGDLPDAILGYGFPYDVLCSYADAGLLAPLDEYFELYGDNVYSVIEADFGPSTMGYVTYDGQKWAVPSGGALVTNLYGSHYARIQTSFLEALGMDMPQTLDELYEYLVAVRDNDVNGNGDPNDEIPMMGCADWFDFIVAPILNAYQYVEQGTYLKVVDDKVEFVANNEEFKAAVEFIKKLVDENLLDPASFTQDKSVLATIMSQADGYKVGLAAIGNYPADVMDSTTEAYLNLRMMDNLEGPNGYLGSMTGDKTVRAAMVITSAATEEERAAIFRLYDFLLSDESAIAVRVGFEGSEWKKADEGVIGRDGQQAWFSLLTTQEWVQPSTNVIWCMESFIHSNIMNHCEATATTAKYPTSYDIVEHKLVEEDVKQRLPQLLMSPEDQAEYDELKNLIVNSVKENIALFVLGDRPMEEWDAYAAEFERMGLERYIELAQTAYDACNPTPT